MNRIPSSFLNRLFSAVSLSIASVSTPLWGELQIETTEIMQFHETDKLYHDFSAISGDGTKIAIVEEVHGLDRSLSGWLSSHTQPIPQDNAARVWLHDTVTGITRKLYEGELNQVPREEGEGLRLASFDANIAVRLNYDGSIAYLMMNYPEMTSFTENGGLYYRIDNKVQMAVVTIDPEAQNDEFNWLGSITLPGQTAVETPFRVTNGGRYFFFAAELANDQEYYLWSTYTMEGDPNRLYFIDHQEFFYDWMTEMPSGENATSFPAGDNFAFDISSDGSRCVWVYPDLGMVVGASRDYSEYNIIATDVNVNHVSISDNGQVVAYGTRNQDWTDYTDLLLINNFEGTDERVLDPGGFYPYRFDLNDDGSILHYSLYDNYVPRIYRIRTDGSGTRQKIGEGDYLGGSDDLSAFLWQYDVNGYDLDNIGYTRLTGSPAITVESYFPTSSDRDGTWRSSGWFGIFAGNNFPLIKHMDHGWMYCAGTGGDFIYLYDLREGWLYTRPSLYPFFYSFQTDNWLFFRKGSKAPRWFYDYSLPGWRQVN